ncbi:T9SS type A sorting domain-containing protein [Psychroserpens sp. MEBiC05023]
MNHKCIVFLFLISSNILISQEIVSNSQDINLQNTPVFKFHPNPTEDQIFIIGTHKIKTVEILDILGKRVAFFQLDKSIIKLNISELKPGMYLLRVIDKYDKHDTKQLIVK